MIGERLAHYRIVDKLGEGGMGVLYRARDARLDRDVALKLLHPDTSEGASRRRRLVQEARAASALNHPHIVTVYDVGRAALQGREVDYIAMECVEGRSLRQVIDERPLGVGEVLDYAVQIAKALAAAHEAGIVHRDLKPANLMLTAAGQVKVLDFGVAKQIGGHPAGEPASTETAGETSVDTETHSRPGALVGTVTYMSPEQVEGKALDGRSDLFALGVVLFEMLSGRRPFEGGSHAVLVAAILRDPPPSLRSLRADVPRGLERLVGRCLAKDPRDRYTSAGELLVELEACRARLDGRDGSWSETLRRPRHLVPIVIALAAMALGTWQWWRRAPARWARDTALPEIDRLVAANELERAYWLARRAAPLLPGDPRLERFWRERCFSVSLKTSPPGASVEARPYGSPDAEWVLVGHTPLAELPFPIGTVRLRIAKDGYEPIDAAVAPGHAARSLEYTMDPAGTLPAGMVRIPGGTLRFRDHPPVQLDDYWLDRYEVTNRAYKEFVDEGGYRSKEYWKAPFVKLGSTVTWEDAMGAFRDATGRPGPATWELGTYPEGQADHPVGGVSWFEAAAYAEFARKELPSFYHWYRATDVGLASVFADIVHFSNFTGKGSVPVGSLEGIAPFGNADMAGNVQEWSATAAGEERYILGGGWNEPAHTYISGNRSSPWAREAANGLRCLRATGAAARAPSPPAMVERDVSAERPASDEAFRSYRGFFSYDRGDLSAAVETVEEDVHWRREKVSFAAPYGGERVTAHLFLPRNASPPYQTIVFYPTGEAYFFKTSDYLRMAHFDFVIRSGRAVLHPIYKGMYERRVESGGGPNAYRDVVVQQVKDFSRSLDYLETRGDIDTSRLGVLSVSSNIAVLVLALEERLKVGLLHACGLSSVRLPGEVDPLHYAPRVRQPVLMLNGRYDSDSPVETSQRPLLRLLGTPEADKRLVLVDSGHAVVRSLDRVRESLDWLDRYLGPVQGK